jgi:hypothetical protein
VTINAQRADGLGTLGPQEPYLLVVSHELSLAIEAWAVPTMEQQGAAVKLGSL